MESSFNSSAILLGDEIGQLKKIDFLKNESVTIKLVDDELINPSKSIVSINPLKQKSNFHRHFLVSRKDHGIFIYDALNDETLSVKYINENKSFLVASQCVDNQNIVVGFQDGSIKRINVENYMCHAQFKPNLKAVNFLGLETFETVPILKESRKRKRKDEKLELKASKLANNEISEEIQDIVTIFEPKWNVENTYLTCFKVKNEKLAVGGYNFDLRVFDLQTGKNIYTTKTTSTDWLGLKQDIWISDIDWISTDDHPPNIIATCSRCEPYVRIYDIRQKQRKSVMAINLKNISAANNESNYPSSTSICSLPSLNNYGHTTSLIVGTTLGRMLAFDLRLKCHYSKVLGSFKAFGGGSIRDIKFLPENRFSHKIISCSLDRFVRVHTMTKSSRVLERKIFVKTRPTCLHPLQASNHNEASIELDDEME